MKKIEIRTESGGKREWIGPGEATAGRSLKTKSCTTSVVLVLQIPHGSAACYPTIFPGLAINIVAILLAQYYNHLLRNTRHQPTSSINPRRLPSDSYSRIRVLHDSDLDVQALSRSLYNFKMPPIIFRTKHANRPPHSTPFARNRSRRSSRTVQYSRSLQRICR